MVQEIYIIDNDNKCIENLQEMFKNDKEYKFKSVKKEHLDVALRNIPALIIINEDTINGDIIEICKQIRTNEDNSITPIIVTSSNTEKSHRIEVLQTQVEYFIKKPIDSEYIYYTIKNIVRLMYINRRVSPLTGLPGNVQIQAELKKRLLNKEEFAVLYFDLDNFKAYNEVYGFLRGDKILKFMAKVIVKRVHSDTTDNFDGHIGGDDFVGIISQEDYERICQDIIIEFDQEVLKYFSDEDAEKGYIETTNRKGVYEQFPLTSISIGVVTVKPKKFHNILEIGEIGAQVKHQAKATMGSSYVIDRRN